jgi:hypothetical protein
MKPSLPNASIWGRNYGISGSEPVFTQGYLNHNDIFNNIEEYCVWQLLYQTSNKKPSLSISWVVCLL